MIRCIDTCDNRQIHCFIYRVRCLSPSGRHRGHNKTVTGICNNLLCADDRLIGIQLVIIHIKLQIFPKDSTGFIDFIYSQLDSIQLLRSLGSRISCHGPYHSKPNGPCFRFL